LFGANVVLMMVVVVSLILPLLWLFVPATMMTLGTMSAITQASAMDYSPENSGTASALSGAMQFSVAGLISAASALLPESVLAVIAAQAVCSGLCLVLVWRVEPGIDIVARKVASR